MASIPLPALDLKTPQQPDLLSQYGNLLQLQNMKAQQANIPLQTQALQNQVQSSGLQVQQQQRQLKDQEAMTTAMQQWDGKDYNALVPLVVKNGGSAQAVMGLKKNILDQQTQIATANKDNSQATEAQVTATGKKNDMIAGALSPLLDPAQVPDQALPQTLLSTVQSLTQQGLLDPQHAQAALKLVQSGDPTSIRSGIDQFRKTLMAQSQIQDEALKTAQTQEAQAHAQQIQQQMQFGPTGPAAEAKYRFILSKKVGGQPLTAGEVAFAKSYEASQAKSTTQSDSLGVTSSNFSRPAGLSAVGGGRGAAIAAPNSAPNPGSGAPGIPSAQETRQSLVDLIGNYQANPNTMRGIQYKHPEILGLVHAKYPDWDETNYDAKNKVAQYFTSGKGGQQLTAFNTAIAHLGTLDKLAADLNNTNLQVVNRAKQAWADQTGSPAPANFAAAKNAMAGEVAAALKASGATDQEIEKVGDTFSRSQSPAQLSGAIGTYRSLLNSKKNALEDQYHQGLHGQPNFGGNASTPSVGDVKTFPNGAKGKWDGHGWVAQ